MAREPDHIDFTDKHGRVSGDADEQVTDVRTSTSDDIAAFVYKARAVSAAPRRRSSR